MLDGAARIQCRQLLQPSQALAATTTAMPPPPSSATAATVTRGAVGRRRASAFVRRVSMAIPTLTADPVPFSAVSMLYGIYTVTPIGSCYNIW